MTSILRATLDSLAGMLSVREDQIEDALASERLARAGMSRRGFFRGTTAAAAALALPTGLIMAEAPKVVLASRLSLAANVAAIDAINKVIVMQFDGLFARDWSWEAKAIAMPQRPLPPPLPRPASKATPLPRASDR